MTFAQPVWLLLLPVLVCLGFFFRRLQLHRPLRVMILLLLTLLLCEPRLSQRDASLDLWVLIDRSASTENLIEKQTDEWLEILADAKPSGRDRLRVVNYASEVLVEGEGEAAVYSGKRDLTRTPLALQTTLALAEEDRSSRVLLFSDGYSTEPLVDLGEKLAQQDIPLDLRLVRDDQDEDFRISRLAIPPRTLIGEPFVISVTCRGQVDGALPLEIFRGDERLLETRVNLVNGVGQVDFTDRLGRPGSYRYRARIIPSIDAHIGNNVMDQWIEITGGPRLLVLSGFTNDPLAQMLQRQGFAVELVTKTQDLHLGQLAGARACIFHNVPAHQVPRDFQKALAFFVRDQGGGLLMIGGESSFGSGGYHESPVDDLLPVSMELKNEHRKLTTALAIVLDRSGSMSMNVGKETKMDLANSGAVNAINLLGENDHVMVTAVDSKPHTFVPLTRLRGRRAELIDQVRRIQSKGGGIFVYNGLAEAWKHLRKAPSKTRHVILFSDASDTEQPDAYKTLLSEMTAQGVTTSVIGLGTDKDSDAPLLEDIATRGKGRIFFTDKAQEVPVIFSQETVTIARSAFLDEVTGTQPTGSWTEISPKEPQWLTQIDGYNLSYLRPGATASLLSKDEYLAPLIAHQRVGAGRSMAISFPLGGEHSDQIRTWQGYGDLIQTVGRWLMGLDLPAGLALKPSLEGTQFSLDLLYDPGTWADRLAETPPEVRLTNDLSGSYDALWERIAPGRFALTRDLEEGSVLRGSAIVGDFTLPFGPFTVGSGAEWAFNSEAVAELKQVSAQSGGRELLDLKKAWILPEQVRLVDLRVWLAGCLLGLLLLDALITRTGWKMPLFQRAGSRARAIPAPASKPAEVEEVMASMEKPTKSIVPKPANLIAPSVSPADRRSRFERAKRRR